MTTKNRSGHSVRARELAPTRPNVWSRFESQDHPRMCCIIPNIKHALYKKREKHRKRDRWTLMNKFKCLCFVLSPLPCSHFPPFPSQSSYFISTLPPVIFFSFHLSLPSRSSLRSINPSLPNLFPSLFSLRFSCVSPSFPSLHPFC